MKNIVLVLTLLGGASFAGPRPECAIAVSGKILYRHQGAYRRVTATLRGTSPECASLSVTGTSGYPTSNRVDKMTLHKEKSGRERMTMVFESPPAIGEGEAVVFDGTYVREGADATFYGDIYQRHVEESECAPTQWHTNRDCWVHKGGFYFNSLGK